MHANHMIVTWFYMQEEHSDANNVSQAIDLYSTIAVRHYMSICLYLSVCLSVCLSLCLSVSQSVCLSVCLSICPSVCLSVSLSVSLSACLSVCLSICPSVCLSIIWLYSYNIFSFRLELKNFVRRKRLNMRCYQTQYKDLMDKWIYIYIYYIYIIYI